MSADADKTNIKLRQMQAQMLATAACVVEIQAFLTTLRMQMPADSVRATKAPMEDFQKASRLMLEEIRKGIELLDD